MCRAWTLVLLTKKQSFSFCFVEHNKFSFVLYLNVSVLALCRDDWHADLRSTRSKLAQAEQLARAKESEVEDLRKAYEVLPDHHHQIACVSLLVSLSDQELYVT